MTRSADFTQNSRTGLTGGNVCSVIEGVRRHAAARPTAEAYDIGAAIYGHPGGGPGCRKALSAPHMRDVGARTGGFLYGDYPPNLPLFALAAEGSGAERFCRWATSTNVHRDLVAIRGAQLRSRRRRSLT